jgi:hypothetical protein
MNLEMRRGVLLVPALAATLSLAGCGGVSRRDYVARNEAIVASLPVFPGAVKTHEVSTPFVKTEGGLSTRPSGYRTLVLYRVPRGTRGEAVIRFYEARLGRRGWDSLDISGSVPVANFTRGRALVAVDAVTATPTGRWTYAIVVDHRGASSG